MGLLSISLFSKTCTFLYFYILHFLHPVHFLEQLPSPSPSPFAHLPLFFKIKSPQPCFHKSYLESKTFVNIRAVPSKAVFYSNAVLITTPSSSMHFSSFFDMLPNAPNTTGMTLMLLMFHILLISIFSSWYLSIFYFSFSLTLMSPIIAISIMAQILSFLFTTTISGFLAMISPSNWIITSHKSFTSSSSTTHSGACSYHFSLLSRLYFPHNFQ